MKTCVVVILLATLAACAAKPARIAAPVGPPAARADLVVLLPDGNGEVGAAGVSNALGAVDLAAAGASTRVSSTAAPSTPAILTDDEVQQMFGEVRAALPPAPQRFTVYFRFESEELTAESRARVPEILKAVKQHPAPDVSVVGHTDTTGPATRNLQLGLSRAQTVRSLLIAAGLDASAIEARSHGEVDPLVPTPDEVFESRNRRVDITVR